MTACGGNSAELLDDYDATIARLIADIDGARQSVWITAYIFADDAVGQAVARALGRAVARGLAVRVMFDPVGSARWRKGTRAMLAREGVAFHEALPFRLPRGRTRRDMRNHRKLYVIDGAIGYAGSQNIVARLFSPRRGQSRTDRARDRPGGGQHGRAGRWRLEPETGDPPAPRAIAGRDGGGAASTPPQRRGLSLRWFPDDPGVATAPGARSRDHRDALHFIPDDDILSAMRSASARRVRVDLVVSVVVDQWLVNLSQSSFYDELLAAGVRIHRYRDYLLHAKALCVDGEVGIVGSKHCLIVLVPPERGSQPDPVRSAQRGACRGDSQGLCRRQRSD